MPRLLFMLVLYLARLWGIEDIEKAKVILTLAQKRPDFINTCTVVSFGPDHLSTFLRKRKAEYLMVSPDIQLCPEPACNSIFQPTTILYDLAPLR